jgi:uncharacterized membrane protein YdjX (TVP38/TMEM64 family)
MAVPRTEAIRLGLPLVTIAALAVAWRSEVLRSLLGSLPDHAQDLAALPGAHFVIIAAFVVAGFAAVPLSALVVATAAALGPVEGGVISLAGGIASATAVFAVGRLAGREPFDSLIGDRGREITERIADRGVLAIAVLRNIPVAPFSIVNLVAGASPVTLRDFVIGTTIGLVPGIAMLTLVGDRLMNALRSPNATNLALLAAALVALAVFGIVASRWLRSSEAERDGG